VLAALKLAQDQPSVALSVLDRYFRQIDRTSITATWALHLQAEAQLRTADIDTAAATVAELRDLVRRHEWPEGAARASMAKGSLALAIGDRTAALCAFEAAMSAFAQLGIVHESAWARLSAAGVLAEMQSDLAPIEAAGVLSAFERLGAQPGAVAASALLRKLGVPARPGPRMGGVLSRREEEVLQLVSHGLSNPEIADRLVISRKTAAHHVSSLLSKLGLRNRAEAVAYAARNGRAHN
jgi:DNA-binding CsgD family transcriptional regulator